MHSMRIWAVTAWLMMFLAGHVSPCQAECRCIDGKRCAPCATLVCSIQDSLLCQEADVLAFEHGDCHDCCFVAHCDEGTKHQPLIGGSSHSLPFATISDPPVLSADRTLPSVAERFAFLLGAQPTGPPGSGSPRAPPL